MSIGRLSWKVDILNESAIQNVCESIMERLGPISILVNATAPFVLKGIDAMPEDWDKMTVVNGLVGGEVFLW